MNTHDEIAAALTRLYKFFVKMGHLVESEINWPPPFYELLYRRAGRSPKAEWVRVST